MENDYIHIWIFKKGVLNHRVRLTWQKIADRVNARISIGVKKVCVSVIHLFIFCMCV